MTMTVHRNSLPFMTPLDPCLYRKCLDNNTRPVQSSTHYDIIDYLIDNRVFLNKLEAAGGVAQVVRACGSYPQGHWFESSHRHH